MLCDRTLTRPLPVVVIGLFLSLILFNTFKNVSEWIYMQKNVDSIFQVSVNIPDFGYGENPLILYDVMPSREILADYRVEIKRLSNEVVCFGSTSNVTYTPLGASTQTTLDQVIGAPCAPNLIPEKYYMDIAYKISVEGKPDRLTRIKSNIFQVR